MEIKSNEATALRPEGDRLLNASLVEIDLNKFIAELKQETTWTESDRNSNTVFKSDNLTIVLVGLHANAELKTHTAKGHINVQVLDGGDEIHCCTTNSFNGKWTNDFLTKKYSTWCVCNQRKFFLLTMMIIDY